MAYILLLFTQSFFVAHYGALMNINRYTFTMICIAMLSLTGCQTIGSLIDAPKPKAQPIESAIISLNEQLTTSPYFSVVGKRMVSATFVWSDTLMAKTKNQNMKYLGALLQESISTHLTQAGANLLEIKSAKAIYLTPTSELILTRDGKKIDTHTLADYVITGIMTPSKYGTIINAKIINLHNKQVVAAARQVIATMNSSNIKQRSSSIRDGMLHRNDLNQGNDHE